jgi:hypothetical protein
MKRVCAWCNKSLDDEPVATGPISHGICGRCASEVMSSRSTLRELIDTLESPILVVDRRGCVVDGNLAARSRREHPFPLEPVRAGDLLQCANAGGPGGCGAGAYCLAGCAVRRAIARTLETGESVVGAEGRQPLVRHGKRTTTRVLLSTEKLNGTILLKIIEADDGGAP